MYKKTTKGFKEFQKRMISLFIRTHLDTLASFYGEVPAGMRSLIKVMFNARLRGRVTQLLDRNIERARILTPEQNMIADMKLLTKEERQLLVKHYNDYWDYAYSSMCGDTRPSTEEIEEACVRLEAFERYVVKLRDKYNAGSV